MKKTNQKINLAIVDDDKLIVQLLSDFIQKSERFEVGLTAHSGNTFLAKLENEENLPEIVLVDLRMDDGDGIFVIETIKRDFPEIQIVVLSSHARTTFIGYMLKMGINAFLPKQLDKTELLEILEEVVDKGHYFTTEQVEVLRSQIKVKSPELKFTPTEELTERELEVLELICQQYTAREIAEKLFITTKAVEARKSNLMLKLNAKNVAGLIIIAVQQKLIDPEKILFI